MWCILAQFLCERILLEIPNKERAHCSNKHEGGSSHPNNGFESVIHVHRERLTTELAACVGPVNKLLK